MKVGDLAIFSNADSKYKQWFLGEFATVMSLSESSCRVRWKRPISYFDSKAVVSDFPRASFTHLG